MVAVTDANVGDHLPACQESFKPGRLARPDHRRALPRLIAVAAPRAGGLPGCAYRPSALPLNYPMSAKCSSTNMAAAACLGRPPEPNRSPTGKSPPSGKRQRRHAGNQVCRCRPRQDHRVAARRRCWRQHRGRSSEEPQPRHVVEFSFLRCRRRARWQDSVARCGRRQQDHRAGIDIGAIIGQLAGGGVGALMAIIGTLRSVMAK